MDKEVANLIVNMIQLDREYRGRMGSTYGGNRDMYTVLGYPISISFEDYDTMYKRQDIATRIVRFPAEETWSVEPLIFDGKAPPVQSEQLESTAFEKEWIDFARKYDIFPMLSEADAISGIGHFGIIVFNIAGQDYATPLTSASQENMLKFSVFHEGDVINITYDSDRKSPRYGFPLYYDVQRWMDQDSANSNKRQDTVRIHYSRVVHIAENSKDGVIGIPRLRGLYNRLIDLEKLSGGGAEATWKLMNKGYALDVSPEYELAEEDESMILEQLAQFDQGLRRFLLTRGVDVNPLGSEVVDPTGMYNVILDLIAAHSGIPKRILVGSERGELASSQDERNWARTIASRQKRYAEPIILRPFIDRMIYYGILPTPTDEYYDIRWKSIMQMTPYEQSRITAAVSAAIVSVAQAPNIITPQEFRSKYLQLPAEPEPGMGELKSSQGEEGAPVTAGGFISSPVSGRKPGPDESRQTKKVVSNVADDDFHARVAVEYLFNTIGAEYEFD